MLRACREEVAFPVRMSDHPSQAEPRRHADALAKNAVCVGGLGQDCKKRRDLAALKLAKAETGKGKPVCIIMKTEMGYGVDFMMGSHAWHGIAPNDEQLKDALSQLEETLGDY